MARLEDLKKDALVQGVLPSKQVRVVDVRWHGSSMVTLFYVDESGRPGSMMLSRDHEPGLEVVERGAAWSFDSDPALFKLAAEAQRINMAYLFDPWMAVHTSFIEPLPHQISAVYGEMLPRQPLRFLLADDPGAGKTIMTGLYIKELMLRGDLERCLVVAPGNLCEQWQDELDQKFNLPFEILTNDRIEASRTGNPFNEINLMVARLDKLSRDENTHEMLRETDWDLVVVDEAHKMSATVFGGETKYTKRYRLGQLLSKHTRNLLLLTATPHNGKEEDFQLFLALIDADRFEGRFRKGVHSIGATDLMRRMVKENLLRFDGRKLFPERFAETVGYPLSDEEAALYAAVTTYVSEEFNRAEALERDGRRGTVGFAMTILQRRLASSPEAIYKSLKRRRERLEDRLREEKLLKRGTEARFVMKDVPEYDEEALEDLDDAPDEEFDRAADQVLDLATASQTIAELEAEIETLNHLEAMADRVRRSGHDTKWIQLSSLLSDNEYMFEPNGRRRKLVVFTEHRDTMTYLADRIRTLLGRHDAVVTIAGGMSRRDRRYIQDLFVQDPEVQVLVATDAASEGINLQRAHLMVNYDLPWNPARLEQRFGRIHRIGQTEVCRLWNLVAEETREGYVYMRLLEKIEAQRQALGDGVFDVMGQLFQDKSLRSLLIEAVRYGESEDVRERLFEQVDNLTDQERCRVLIEKDALVREVLGAEEVQRIRREFERAQARRLQPHFISSFFREAFAKLGGKMFERETRRYEIKRVPSVVRSRARDGSGRVLARYERVTFEKDLAMVQGKPAAELLAPGHPLMDAVISVILERYRELLKRGAVLVDPEDESVEPRAMVVLEHAVRDGVEIRGGGHRVVSKRMQFVELGENGGLRVGGPAPFLDYRPPTDAERERIEERLDRSWLQQDLEQKAVDAAVEELLPRHMEEVKAHRMAMVQKTRAAVHERLTKEISYWDLRAQQLREREQVGKRGARLNSEMASRRVEGLQERLQRRMAELDQEAFLASLPPVVIGGALIVPAGMLQPDEEMPAEEAGLFGLNRALVEQAGMEAVMGRERALGFEPVDVSSQNLGWDIESGKPGDGKLRFIEVKGRQAGATTVTVSKNEILAGLNKPEDFILAVVLVHFREDGRDGYEGMEAVEHTEVHYIQHPFQSEPDFGVTSVNYEISKMVRKG